MPILVPPAFSTSSPSESVTTAVTHGSKVRGSVAGRISGQSTTSPVPASTTDPVIDDSRGITPPSIAVSRGCAGVTSPAVTSTVSTELRKPKYSVVSW